MHSCGDLHRCTGRKKCSDEASERVNESCMPLMLQAISEHIAMGSITLYCLAISERGSEIARTLDTATGRPA